MSPYFHPWQSSTTLPSKPTIPHSFSIRSDDGLTPETSALLYRIYCILLGRILSCPEGKGTRGLQGPIRRCCPTSPTPHSHTKDNHSTGVTLLFSNSAWVLLRPKELSTFILRNWETGPQAYRPYPRSLGSLTIRRWNYKGSTFSSVI